MIKLKENLKPEDLKAQLSRLWDLSGQKIALVRDEYDTTKGAPVYTVKGKYTTRGWTEWTEGFVYGSAILHYDATGEKSALEYGKEMTVRQMASHVSHFGVHDHGFNNVSTYGNLLRLMNEGVIPENEWEKNFYEIALKVSGAVQAYRWTKIHNGEGYIYSFNGPHSLFADTIRSLRSLAVGHRLGHVLMGENDKKISLLERLLQHARTTARYSVYYGEGRDYYDIRGRTTHEAIFNLNDGNFRAPNSQQGFSPFTTWTRGLSWIMAGYPEELEFLQTLSDDELEPYGGRAEIEAMMLKAAKASCDFFIEHTPVDGVPYWDTGAPELHRLGNYLDQPADPDNPYEPVDSSAAAIGAQGLLRLGRYLKAKGEKKEGERYWQAGLTVAESLFTDTYLSTDETHQGLLLHSIYHRPNGWDHIPADSKIPRGESCQWGDYHLRELAIYLQRLVDNKPYYTFFGS
ncbi:MAG: glycosyl hydrolase [Opitutales bacterium]|nr:glycosyl hydrolase [Opitutales bacterium]MCH8541676.1 glycosyl hydrolase [Opitutales bacterium]